MNIKVTDLRQGMIILPNTKVFAISRCKSDKSNVHINNADCYFMGAEVQVKPT